MEIALAIISIALTLWGFLPTVALWAFESPGLPRTPHNIAVAIGILGLCAVLLVLVSGYAANRLDDHGAVATRSTPAPPPTSSLEHVDNPAPPAPSAEQADNLVSSESLRFNYPSEGEKFGKLMPPVKLTGSVPSNKHLWIIVQSSEEYFIQGEPKKKPSGEWELSGVNLGSISKADNGEYIIHAVVADEQADDDIQRVFAETHGDTGTPEIPGGAGAKIADTVKVTRTHV